MLQIPARSANGPNLFEENNMQRLIEGIHRFQLQEWGHYEGLFHRLSREGQKPHTLFITCCDSRVLAELITQSQPGDLFVVKNVGNIVPPASQAADGQSTAAAIEFAVSALQVSDIVVCGHSQCGAMTALLQPPHPQMPYLSRWLTMAAPVKKILEENYSHLTELDDRVTAAAEENVLFALENLRSYPSVTEALLQGTVRLHGWFFKISSGELFTYRPQQQQFVRI